MTVVAPELMGHVTLNDNSVIVVGRDETHYVVVRYMRRSEKVKAAHIPANKFDDMVRRGILPRGYHTNWARATARNKDLTGALRELGTHPYPTYNADEVRFYISVTRWGADL